MPKCAFQQHPVALFRWPEMSSCRWWLFGPMGPAFAVQNFSTVLEMHFYGSKCTRLATGDADVSPHHEHRCACPRPVLQRSPRGALQVQERWCSSHLILVFGTILLCRERHLEPRTVFTVGVETAWRWSASGRIPFWFAGVHGVLACALSLHQAPNSNNDVHLVNIYNIDIL